MVRRIETPRTMTWSPSGAMTMPADLTERGILEAMIGVERHIDHAHGWDQPHSLWVIVRNLEPSDAEFTALPLLTFTAADMRRPVAEVFREIAARARRAGLPPHTETQFVAWMFAVEAWRQQHRRRCWGQRKPGRVRERGVIAVDTAELVYAVIRTQDSEEVTVTIDDVGGVVGGKIPDELLHLVRATETIVL